jgi:chromosome segregation ATPase
MRYGTSSGDPFAKVKTLITDMISKLESEASADATEKAYCDEELSKSGAKKGDLDDEIAKLSTKIDQATADSTALKSEVKELQEELAKMEKEQADNTKWREDEHAEYVVSKKDLEEGVAGVRKALDVLRNYYGGAAFVQQPAPPAAFEKATGAGESIIGILEVCESDFATDLAKVETAEADSQSTYDTLTQEYKVTKAKKDQDVKYKTQEFTSLDKTVSELSSDRETAGTELAEVEEYLSKLKDRCIAKPESYAERKARRDAEIKGLKEALSVLENETALVQRRGRGKHMRGSLAPGM